MAKRGRVPRHKSHNHQRNKNPKLSPFQREQKRTKLANQAPTAKSMGSLEDIPHSQRRLAEYLRERKEREAARRLRLEEARAKEEEEEAQAAAKPVKKKRSRSVEDEVATGSVMPEKKKKRRGSEPEGKLTAATATEETPKATKKKKAPTVESLNETILEGGVPLMTPRAQRRPLEAPRGSEPATVEEIIARKKEKKHMRKVEERRQRVAEQLQKVEADLNALVTKKGRKAKKEEVAYEKELKRMQREEAKRKATEAAKVKKGASSEASGSPVASKKRRSSADDGTSTRSDIYEGHSDADSQSMSLRKSISFSDVDEAQDQLPHRAMRFPGDVRTPREKSPKEARKAKDFYELVDVVRFGERVDAPPVFDVVPNKHAAVSKLANKLEAENQPKNLIRRRLSGGSSALEDRQRLLSSVGGLGEQKRLARLGLAPAVTQHVSERNGGGANKSKEMELLRSSVMATYQMNRRKEVNSKKGVDMHHVFPQFS